MKICGVATPLSLQNVILLGKRVALDEGKSNRVIVGTICEPSSIPKVSGGELLNSIQNLKVRSLNQKHDNINFFFHIEIV